MSNSDKTICKEDEEDIISLSKTSNIIDILSESLFPEIEGHKTIKLQKIIYSRSRIRVRDALIIRFCRELKNGGKIPENMRIVLHSIRNGCIMDLLEKLPIDAVSKIFRYSDVKVTMRYIDDKKRNVDFLKLLKKI